MRTRTTAGRVLGLLTVIVLALALSVPIVAQQPSPDLTGSWKTKVKGGGSKALGTLAVSQDALAGSFIGTLTTNDNPPERIDLEGTFTVDDRDMWVSLEVSLYDPPRTESFSFPGRCNRKGTKMKWKFFDNEGDRIKFRLKKRSGTD